MLIGVDVGCLGVKDERLKVGVYQVAKNLLLELAGLDTKNHYLLYSFYPIDKKLLQSLGSHFRNIVIKPSRGWTKVWLPLRLLIDKPDIFVGLSQSLPSRWPGSKYKTLVILYDLVYEKFPEFYNDYFRLQKNTSFAVITADRILTISQSTKRDIVKEYSQAVSKIEVGYLGVTPQTSLKAYKASKPYFLFVGALKPAKNLPTVLRAFNLFCSHIKKPYDLYVVGGDKWLDSRIQEEFVKLPKDIQKRIHFVGVVSEKRLWEFYKGAVALVMPSLYEGFGLPVVEAMAVGCPVIASNVGALPEVVKNAGLLVPPKDEKKFAEYMREIVSDTTLRNEMKKKGVQRAKMFHWVSFATQVLDIITSL